jgi:hypothetical protein
MTYRIELHRHNRIEVLDRVTGLPPKQRTLDRLVFEHPGSRALRVIREIDELVMSEMRFDQPEGTCIGAIALFGAMQ